MPAFYAHERFGKKSGSRQRGILRKLFGVIIRSSGLDFKVRIFFSFIVYIRIIKFQNTEQICMRFRHTHSFLRALEIVRRKGRETKEYAYLLGFLCHYILDSESTPM